MLEFCRDTGKEHGIFYITIGIYWGYIEVI